ncbi:hypothetical protein KAR91_64525 [Candidatus Pacearchaeota archaeon]|nr:hypothetical protein [Candidatus Pacearchaeota archaeon]
MINNNMKMIKQLKNIPDYEEYVSLCQENDIKPNDLNRYCMGVGMLSVALFKYPDLKWQEAYTNIMTDMNTPNEIKKKEENGCCGGKKKEPIDEKPLGLIATGKNLLKSTTEHISKGMKSVPHEEHLRRLSICKDCEWIKDGFQCGKCHCFMGIKAGWDIKNICKLNKW